MIKKFTINYNQLIGGATSTIKTCEKCNKNFSTTFQGKHPVCAQCFSTEGTQGAASKAAPAPAPAPVTVSGASAAQRPLPGSMNSSQYQEYLESLPKIATDEIKFALINLFIEEHEANKKMTGPDRIDPARIIEITCTHNGIFNVQSLTKIFKEYVDEPIYSMSTWGGLDKEKGDALLYNFIKGILTL